MWEAREAPRALHCEHHSNRHIADSPTTTAHRLPAAIKTPRLSRGTAPHIGHLLAEQLLELAGPRRCILLSLLSARHCIAQGLVQGPHRIKGSLIGAREGSRAWQLSDLALEHSQAGAGQMSRILHCPATPQTPRHPTPLQMPWPASGRLPLLPPPAAAPPCPVGVAGGWG